MLKKNSSMCPVHEPCHTGSLNPEAYAIQVNFACWMSESQAVQVALLGHYSNAFQCLNVEVCASRKRFSLWRRTLNEFSFLFVCASGVAFSLWWENSNGLGEVYSRVMKNSNGFSRNTPPLVLVPRRTGTSRLLEWWFTGGMTVWFRSSICLVALSYMEANWNRNSVDPKGRGISIIQQG
jgi:hypothetical protein